MNSNTKNGKANPTGNARQIEISLKSAYMAPVWLGISFIIGLTVIVLAGNPAGILRYAGVGLVGISAVTILLQLFAKPE